jgi:hypothetical protein
MLDFDVFNESSRRRFLGSSPVVGTTFPQEIEGSLDTGSSKNCACARQIRYPTKKNGEMMRRIIRASTNEGDIVNIEPHPLLRCGAFCQADRLVPSPQAPSQF